jgi:hypothetical protein
MRASDSGAGGVLPKMRWSSGFFRPPEGSCCVRAIAQAPACYQLWLSACGVWTEGRGRQAALGFLPRSSGPRRAQQSCDTFIHPTAISRTGLEHIVGARKVEHPIPLLLGTCWVNAVNKWLHFPETQPSHLHRGKNEAILTGLWQGYVRNGTKGTNIL